MRYNLHQGDCLDVLRTMPDASVDAVVTDPPYGLGRIPDINAVLKAWMAGEAFVQTGGGFMGKEWDSFVPGPDIWRECLRVLKPGGHILAFAGTRTQDVMALALRMAGFEIRDMIAWVYGSGMPKSLNVSKAIDKAAGAEREVVGLYDRRSVYDMGDRSSDGDTGDSQCAGRSSAVSVTAPATDDAKRWEGWGTALKPALEPVTVARKPFKGTVAANVLAHGTGGINIDGCRVGNDIVGWGGGPAGGNTWTKENSGLCKSGEARPVEGRWPANMAHDGSDEVLALFPKVKSGATSGSEKPSTGRTIYGGGWGAQADYHRDASEGSAARFYYCAKASKKDRGEGNNHPTVKPTDLMRYLCRLVTPPGGTVLDPFMGSGSTGKAAMLEGFRFIGIEREAEYIAIARARIEEAAQ